MDSAFLSELDVNLMPVIKLEDGGARVSRFWQSIGNSFRKHLFGDKVTKIFGDKGANLLGDKATGTSPQTR